jgi:cellulose synthase/poly-beta-1,6-N-acetylglucosamine synthase-like glycosyltransferase
MDLLECAFWISATFVSYGTIGYPLLMWVLARLAPHPIRTGSALPSVTCVLAARDESSVIGTKLGNLLSLDYPPERLDIVVVSDGSVDRTVPAVRDWIDRAPGRIRLVEVPVPQGKAHALNLGVAQARGDIVLFADARQRVDRRALRALAQNFADPRVGAVSGELVLEEQTPADPRRALASYWQFEKFLRRAESRSGTVVGCTGAIYAIRRASELKGSKNRAVK